MIGDKLANLHDGINLNLQPALSPLDILEKEVMAELDSITNCFKNEMVSRSINLSKDIIRRKFQSARLEQRTAS